MSRFSDSLARRLAPGVFGKAARHAVRAHPYIAGDPARITVAADVCLSDVLMNCGSGLIRIGSHSFFGHGVVLLAGTHDHRRFGVERGGAIPTVGHDIDIGQGVWIASNVTVIGPCRIGDHAVIAAGAVVTSDVAEYSVVGGVPARVLYRMDRPDELAL